MRRKLEGKAYVEQYVQSLTHEMKSPLAAIRGAAELLQEPLPEADRVHFARSIVDQQERLTETIDKLLALAEVEQHGWLQTRDPIALPTCWPMRRRRRCVRRRPACRCASAAYPTCACRVMPICCGRRCTT